MKLPGRAVLLLPAMALMGMLAWGLAAPALAQESDTTIRKSGDRVSVFSGDIHIPSHVYRRGMVVCIGGDVRVDGTVREDVVVVLGSLEVTGSIRGSAIGILSTMSLDGATIGDQLINIAGSLSQNETDVDGQVVNIGIGDWLDGMPSPLGVLGSLVLWFRVFKILAAFVLILLLAALVPERIRVVAEEAPQRYATAFFVGLLTYVGMWLAVLLLTVTVIGVPVAILVFLVLKWMGICGIFHAFGQRLGRSLGRELSLLGSILLVFAPYALLVILPSFFGVLGLIMAWSFGLVIWIFLEVPAVGLVLLTRAGGQTAPPEPEPFPATPPPLDPRVDPAPILGPDTDSQFP